MPLLPTRRSLRLREYDYSQAGAYFVTVCTKGRNCLFGNIENQVMRMNAIGSVVRQCWDGIPAHFPDVELDVFVVMPNHVHGIVVIGDAIRAKDFSPLLGQTTTRSLQPERVLANGRPRGTSKTIGSVVRGFKIGVTKWVRIHTPVHDLWQRNFWEHVIRDEQELNRVREYIDNNPAQWASDRLNPARIEQ